MRRGLIATLMLIVVLGLGGSTLAYQARRGMDGGQMGQQGMMGQGMGMMGPGMVAASASSGEGDRRG